MLSRDKNPPGIYAALHMKQGKTLVAMAVQKHEKCWVTIHATLGVYVPYCRTAGISVKRLWTFGDVLVCVENTLMGTFVFLGSTPL